MQDTQHRSLPLTIIYSLWISLCFWVQDINCTEFGNGSKMKKHSWLWNRLREFKVERFSWLDHENQCSRTLHLEEEFKFLFYSKAFRNILLNFVLLFEIISFRLKLPSPQDKTVSWAKEHGYIFNIPYSQKWIINSANGESSKIFQQDQSCTFILKKHIYLHVKPWTLYIHLR